MPHKMSMVNMGMDMVVAGPCKKLLLTYCGHLAKFGCSMGIRWGRKTFAGTGAWLNFGNIPCQFW